MTPAQSLQLSSLIESFLIKLPNHPDKYNLECVINSYSRFTIVGGFRLIKTSEKKVLKIIQKQRYLRMSVQTSFLDNFYQMQLRFYQGLYVKSVTKAIERIVNDQTNKFLSENNILYNFQYGFRPNRSTNMCLARLTDKILKGLSESLLTEMILIDLQKAFDTINHEVLLQKLKAIRFSEQSVQWFRPYLFDRIFLVETENKYLILKGFLVEFLKVSSLDLFCFRFMLMIYLKQ